MATSCRRRACAAASRGSPHRIKVQHLAIEHERCGMSPDEICDAHPGLTLSQVHAALAYYYDHEATIRADIEADAKFADELQQQPPA